MTLPHLPLYHSILISTLDNFGFVWHGNSTGKHVISGTQARGAILCISRAWESFLLAPMVLYVYLSCSQRQQKWAGCLSVLSSLS